MMARGDFIMARTVPIRLVLVAALMLVTYFIPNMVILLIVCCALTAVPWVVRES